MRYLRVISFVIVVAIFAQLSIDIPGPGFQIPITGQTLAILSFAIFLSPRESCVGVLLYILLGIIGIPVFSDLGSGWEAFSGNSLGYFIGFLLGATSVSFFASRNKNSFLINLALMFLGTCIILFMGALFLSFKFGISQAFEFGVKPFVIGGVAKIILSAIFVTLLENKMSLR